MSYRPLAALGPHVEQQNKVGLNYSQASPCRQCDLGQGVEVLQFGGKLKGNNSVYPLGWVLGLNDLMQILVSTHSTGICDTPSKVSRHEDLHGLSISPRCSQNLELYLDRKG